MNKLKIFSIALITLLISFGCTDLHENVYDIITTDEFYKSKKNVIQAFVRPFDHAYSASAGAWFQVSENSADHFMTPNRQGHWLDGENYFRVHKNTWTIDDWVPRDAWNNEFRGIVLINSALSDFESLDLKTVGVEEDEMREFIAQLRTLRAWFYLRLFDMFRNIPNVTEYPTEEIHPEQKSPLETFTFIESELKEVLSDLSTKENYGGNGIKQGQWNEAGAISLLVRLYLNAELWIGEDRYDEVIEYAEDLIAGKYGVYELSTRWDAPFDWNNETSDEIIFAFTSSYGYSRYVYGSGMFWWGAPFKAPFYFEFFDLGDMNQRFGLQPGLDLQGNEYEFKNGKPIVKFKKYPDDVRLKKYRNLGNSQREGMFLSGSLQYKDGSGKEKFVKADNGSYNIYLRDQVGWFEDTDTLSLSPKPSGGEPVLISDMNHADQSSGWHLIKYPIYKSTDEGKLESDYAVIRLAEIYYSLAEAKFRRGDKAAAERLLNNVRERYYPQGSPSLYAEQGTDITEQELLDEWGREFIGEGIRRTTLCRFGAYTSEWWDKPAENDINKILVPISRSILDANPNLKQNPGW